MKKEKILKSVLVIFMGILLLAMSTNVFALSDDDFLDISNTVNTDTNTNVNTNVNTNTNTPLNTNVNTNIDTNLSTNTGNYNTNLPHTGIAENTILGVAVTVLAIIAICAYRKVKEYKNI